jgi:hypothetical protein
VHGKQTVNHDHGCARDGKFVGQSLNLSVQLVKGESPTQVQSCEAGFHVHSQHFQTGDESRWVNSAGTIHPMDHFSLSQCMSDPMFSNASHALPCTPGPAQMVELTPYRLESAGVNASLPLNYTGFEVIRCLLMPHMNH